MELSTESKVVVHLMWTLLNPLIRDKDQNAKEVLVKKVLASKGINLTDNQIADYIYAINDEKNVSIKEMFGMIQSMGIDLSKLKISDVFKWKT